MKPATAFCGDSPRPSPNELILQRKSHCDPSLDPLVETGATDIGALEFQSTGIERLRDEALVLAMQRAREKAERLSTAVGVELESIILVAEQFSGGQTPVLAARAAFAESAVPIAPGQQRIEARVTVTFALED